VQGRDLVVELVATLVETASSARRDLAYLLDRDRRATITLGREVRGDLQHAERTPPVAITAMRESDQRFVIDVQVALAEPPFGVLEGTPQHLHDVRDRERTQHVDARA